LVEVEAIPSNNFSIQLRKKKEKKERRGNLRHCRVGGDGSCRFFSCREKKIKKKKKKRGGGEKGREGRQLLGCLFPLPLKKKGKKGGGKERRNGPVGSTIKFFLFPYLTPTRKEKKGGKGEKEKRRKRGPKDRIQWHMVERCAPAWTYLFHLSTKGKKKKREKKWEKGRRARGAMASHFIYLYFSTKKEGEGRKKTGERKGVSGDRSQRSKGEEASYLQYSFEEKEKRRGGKRIGQLGITPDRVLFPTLCGKKKGGKKKRETSGRYIEGYKLKTFHQLPCRRKEKEERKKGRGGTPRLCRCGFVPIQAGAREKKGEKERKRREEGGEKGGRHTHLFTMRKKGKKKRKEKKGESETRVLDSRSPPLLSLNKERKKKGRP